MKKEIKMFKKLKKLDPRLATSLAVVAGMGAALLAPEVLAGTGGAEFDTVWTTLTDWMQGTLGKIASGAMILVGIIAGVARQSLMAFAVGVGGGIGLYNTPTVIDLMMTATLDKAPAATQAIMTISNGL